MFKIIRQSFRDANFDAMKQSSLCNNPFVKEIDCCRLVAFDDDVEIGRVDVIPLQILGYNKVYHVCGGSTLYVKPNFRGRGAATKLTLERLELSSDKIAIASGLSNMSFQLFKKLGFVTFSFPRMILLKKSRSVLERHIKGAILRVTSKIIDFFLSLQKRILKFFSIWNKKRILIEEISKASDDIVNIVKEDKHPFKENHTKEWFDWVLNNPFSDVEHSKQHLFHIIINGKVQGFFMTKERFHEQASHRGFKNIILGSVIEWGVSSDSDISEKQVCMAAVLSFGKHVDAVEICSNDKQICKSLRKCGLRMVGNSNFAFKASKDSPFNVYNEYYNDIDKWRIRPSYSDNGLS